MESSGVALVTFMYVLISRISGAEVEMKVRPGDNAVLYSDCVWKSGFNTIWFRNSSHEHMVIHEQAHPHYSMVWNLIGQTNDLLVRNVTESDLGLYYCALQKIHPIRYKTTTCSWDSVCDYGNRTTRLSFLDTMSQTPSTPSVSDCSVCWKLLVSVCSVCVLLSSTCVYCIYRNTDKGGKTLHSAERSCENTKNPTSRKPDKVGGGDVCYASLDLPNKRQKRLKKRVESFEFCIYSEVKPNITGPAEEDLNTRRLRSHELNH